MGGGHLCLQRAEGELKEKNQDANFSLHIKNPNPLGIKKRIPDPDCQP